MDRYGETVSHKLWDEVILGVGRGQVHGVDRRFCRLLQGGERFLSSAA